MRLCFRGSGKASYKTMRLCEKVERVEVCISPGPSPASTRDGVRDGVVGWPVQLEPTRAEARPLGRWLGPAGVW